VPDPSDQPASRPSARTRRTPKFVLPDHHHDERQGERADEHIEAFLTTTVPRRRRPKAAGRIRRPVELDTRPDWLAAVRHEGARLARYGRPASVLLIELRNGSPAPSIDPLARAVADAIRAEARETDRAVRFGAHSFRMLLPETGDLAARAVADRLDRTFGATAEARTHGATLSIDVASPGRNASLEDALAEAERRLSARSDDQAD
jgi:GGDEF domain-containing protein